MAPTVHGPSFVALQVDDLDAAARFYEETLGLPRAGQAPPGAVVFNTSPVAFAVREASPGTDLNAGPLGLGVALWLACDDAQALYEHLTAQAVPIVTDPFDGPFGRTFAFRDPAGYTVTIHDAS